MLKRLLTADLKLWHLLLLAAVFAFGTGTVVAGQRPAPTADATASSDSFFPSGAFSMTAAASNNNFTVNDTEGDKEALRVAFTVPTGQKADVAAFFNGEAYKRPNGYCYLKFWLDSIGGDALRPGKIWVADGYIYTDAYPTISAQGWRRDIRAGTHTLIVTVQTNGGDCLVFDRSLIVIANRHS